MNRFPSPSAVRLLILTALLLIATAAFADLTIAPLTWNVIGLDSNDVNVGPNNFPIGARVCSDAATTNVTVNYVWDSANAFVDLRGGSLTSINIASIGAGGCEDAYFEVEVNRNASAYDTTRSYHITATDLSGTVSTATPRELYVEHLISQNRNSISDVLYGPDTLSLTSVPAGGSMNLVVGETYVIRLVGGTATQGYSQFEAFINFPNTIFQILDVETSYSADDSPYVANPNDKLYGDACLWDNDPNSPTYRECTGGDFKVGGTNVVTDYTLTILSGGGGSETLNTLLYDFSGSSFHYNADYATGARIANLIDPTNATIAKAFNPSTTSINGVSTLTITIGNPNAGTVSGYNVVDNLPANLVIANPPSASTSGCGAASLTAVAGGSTITFSDGTIAANGTCVISVNVTPTATGVLANTTNNLFIGTTDTSLNASANLTVNTAPPAGPGLCGLTLARWNFETGFSTTSPAPTTANVTATASPGAGIVSATSTQDNTIAPAGTGSWRSNGGVATGTPVNTANDDYFEFAIDTTGYTSVELDFDAFRTNNGPTGVAVFWGTSATPPGTQAFATDNALSAQTTWFPLTHTFNSGLNPSGLTYFRIYGYNSTNANPGSDFHIDNVVFSGCAEAVQPTFAKSFSPEPIAVGGVSTLTFTLTNTNTAALTGAAFTDTFPAGIEVASTPNAATTCGGTWAPAAGNTSVSFSNGTIPASGACTVSVDVTATTSGPHVNVSADLSTTEGGSCTTCIATSTLAAILPPSITKLFSPNPIIANGVSTITFAIANPNQDDAISGVAFTDTFPVAPGAMVVAAVPNASTSGCGAPTFSPTPGAGSVSFSGGSIDAGGTCIVTVDVTAPSNGSYVNTTGNVSHIVNGSPVNGNTAGDTLVVVPPNPSIALLKQVGPSATGPWSTFLPIAVGADVYYQFTVENTGDVALDTITLADDTLDVTSCNTAWSAVTLPVADASDDDHIIQCVVGPVTAVSGANTNIASVEGTYDEPYLSEEESATYATTGLTLDKTAAETSFTNPGDTLNYSYLVTNSGFAPLEGPVTVADDKATVTCPAVTTVGDLDNFLDPAESVTCTASYTIVAGDIAAGFVTNNATATVDGLDSNSDSVTVLSTNAVDVSIDKTLVTGGPYSVGQSISYTLTVANAGPSTATGIDVTDTPTNLTITGVTGACASFPCVIASLASGANTVINVTATIDAVGAFDNSATATPDQPDIDPSDNTDNTGNNGSTGAVDVSLAKTLVTTPPYTVGQSISYTITVANAGPSTATGIDVTDTDTNLTITNVSGACASFPCVIASLASGANTVINVTATIDAEGAFDNSATATPDETDSNPANNTDNDGSSTTPSVDVSLAKTLTTVAPYTVGQSISYTITVANAGPSTATGIDVTDTDTNLTITNVSGACASFPCVIASLASGANAVINVTATIDAEGAFDNSATATPDETDTVPANNTDNDGGSTTPSVDVSVVKTLTTAGPFTAGQSISYTITVANAGPSTATGIDVTDTDTNLTITNVSGACASFPCVIASLAAGANTVINVTATIDAAGAFDNAATAMPDETDSNPANNTDNDGSSTGAGADVSLVKTLDTAGPYSVGQSITYTLLIANAGPATATGIDVTDTPTNLSISAVSGACASLPCVIASLNAGADTSITVTATIVATGAFDNSATATPDETDPTPANNTDSVGNDGVTGPTADLEIEKTASATQVAAGDPLTFTIVVTNNGPSTATNVSVTDTLPANFSLSTAVSTQGTCSGNPAVTCTIGTMLSGATVTITITGTVNGPGTVSNTAVVSATETDPDPDNNTDTISVASSVAGIPTVSEWGLIAMALLLAIAGIVMRK